MSIPFVPLRLHTEYSVEDSIIQLDQLAAAAQQLKLPALAVTDHMNLFAGVKFYQRMVKSGIKPILGIDILLLDKQLPDQRFDCTFLCQNTQGYHHLVELASKAYRERSTSKPPAIYRHWLTGKTDGLIALSGGIRGDIGQLLMAGKKSQAIRQLEAWQVLFPDRFYIELQRLNKPMEEEYIKAVCQLAASHRVPVVATQDTRFLRQEDFEAHEARLCIQQGYTLSDRRRPKTYTSAQYLTDALEMQKLFSDIPSALINTVEIAKRCTLVLELNTIHLPNFKVPKSINVEDFLIQESNKGLALRLATSAKEIGSELAKEKYTQRLEKELEVINKMGFAGYFLIVADFIRWAKSKAIPVGPGRGSGAGSLVAYALEITDVDPLKYGLLFERFLNIERVSLPDFDIDFCMEDRDRVIEYVMNRYGREAVAQIITFGTMAARAVTRDVGRVLGYPYGMVDAIAKLVPFEVGMTLDKALARDQSSELSLNGRYSREEEVKVLIDLARKLEGLVRNVGTHAGGVVIAPQKLTDFTALYYESEGSSPVTQLDKDDLETVGLVKFDFLGLRTLTIINWAITAINKKRALQKKSMIKVAALPLDDPLTFQLLKKAQVTAVFQLESRGMRALLKQLSPDHFEEVVALIALFRPGPLQSGMVEDFIQRKHDASQISYFHPLLEPILKPTYGIILYQEQVMQIAQVLAGYSLGNADLLRRAMGKKKPKEMAMQRAIFIKGSEKNKIDPTLANTMFDLIEKFAGYGFNKSHSVAYALISYQTAWLKAHYPKEFMAAVLSSEMENTDKLADLLYDCRALGLAIKPPNIHTSQYAFFVNDQDVIEYGLGAIKGIGRTAIEHLLTAQAQHGKFTDLFVLCRQVDSEKINKRALEALIHSGALDCLDHCRATLSAQLTAAMQQAHVSASKQIDLFGNITSNVWSGAQVAQVKPWTPLVQYAKEKAVLGVYMSGHPLACYRAEFATLKLSLVKSLQNMTSGHCLCLAWLVAISTKSSAQGDYFAILKIEDETVRMELKLTPEMYQKYRQQLSKDSVLVLKLDCYSDRSRQQVRFVIRQLWNLEAMREQWGRTLKLHCAQASLAQDHKILTDLKQQLKAAAQGQLSVTIEYSTPQASVAIPLDPKWKVYPTNDLIDALRHRLGFENVHLEYVVESVS